MGGGQSGKMTSGLISANWGFAGLSFKAGSLGLSSIDRVYVHPGTIGPTGTKGSFPVTFDTMAAVNTRGSPGNSVTIQALMRQQYRVGSITTTSAYTVFSPAFTGTPRVYLGQGSPNGTIVGSPSFAYVQKIASGSARLKLAPGTPTAYRENAITAIGPGSFPLYYTAIGD